MTIYNVLGLGGVILLAIIFGIFMYYDTQPKNLHKGQKWK